LTATAGIGLLIFAIVRTEQEGWGSATTLGFLAGAAALLAAFLAIEMRHRAPLVPLGVFRLRNLSGGNAVSLMLGGVMFTTFFFVTLYMPQVLGFSPLETGVAYLQLALSVIVASGIASTLMARVGFRPLLAGGMPLLAAGLVWFAQIDPGGEYVSDVLGPSLVWGPGLGVAIVVVIAAQPTTSAARASPGWRPAWSTPRSRSAARSLWRRCRPSRSIASTTQWRTPAESTRRFPVRSPRASSSVSTSERGSPRSAP
jgi:predicted MFS family arabinose efflux permease